jgi:hypothetical protein
MRTEQSTVQNGRHFGQKNLLQPLTTIIKLPINACQGQTRRHDIQHNDTQHNATQPNDILRNSTQHDNK